MTRAATRQTIVVVPSTALRAELGDLPESIRLVDHAPGIDLGPEHLEAEVIVFGFEQRELLGRLGEFASLRLVQSLSAGVEAILPAIPDGVTLTNAAGVHDIPVAEWVVAMLLAHQHLLPRFLDAQRLGEWDHGGNAVATSPEDTPGDDLDGMRVLILGHGSIGRAVEARLAPFGAEVVGITRHGRAGTATPDRLCELAADVDAMVILTPLTSETDGLVGAAVLAELRDGAIVVNAGRGPVLDHAALEVELRSGRLRAALDVTVPEPLPAGHTLWRAPNLIITPHVAGSSRKWQARAYRFVGDQLRRHVAGEPLLNVRTQY